MDSLGVPYRAIAPGVDEDVGQGMTVEETVALLSERKARAVHDQHPNEIVIGSDQLVSLDGKAFGKPADAAQARAQLEALRGRTHEIVTGLCVIGRRVHIEIEISRLTVWADLDVAAYVATNEWQGCAGSYRVEGKGQAIFERIDGDRSTIQGLPMQRLVRLLREEGVVFF